MTLTITVMVESMDERKAGHCYTQKKKKVRSRNIQSNNGKYLGVVDGRDNG